MKTQPDNYYYEKNQTVCSTLSEHHHYPYGREIYVNIFRYFSHFPLRLEDLNIHGDGETITLMAYVSLYCLERRKENFIPFYKKILTDLHPKITPFFPFNISVETFLGCILFFYHPVEIKNTLNSFETDPLFNDKEKYEFELKKRTVLIHAI